MSATLLRGEPDTRLLPGELPLQSLGMTVPPLCLQTGKHQVTLILSQT